MVRSIVSGATHPSVMALLKLSDDNFLVSGIMAVSFPDKVLEMTSWWRSGRRRCLHMSHRFQTSYLKS